MTEPIEVTSLDDIGEVTFIVDIPRPDGQVVRVRLRALTDEKVWEIRNSITWPTAPVKDIKRIDGEVTTIYDYANAEYLKANRKADRDLSRRVLAESLVVDIPGNTLEERATALDKKLGQWAALYLIGVLNKLQEIDEAVIDNAVRSFRLPQVDRVPGHDNSGSVTNGLVPLVESGSS